MKNILSVLLSVIMIFLLGVPVFAQSSFTDYSSLATFDAWYSAQDDWDLTDGYLQHGSATISLEDIGGFGYIVEESTFTVEELLEYALTLSDFYFSQEVIDRIKAIAENTPGALMTDMKFALVPFNDLGAYGITPFNHPRYIRVTVAGRGTRFLDLFVWNDHSARMEFEGEVSLFGNIHPCPGLGFFSVRSPIPGRGVVLVSRSTAQPWHSGRLAITRINGQNFILQSRSF